MIPDPKGAPSMAESISAKILGYDVVTVPGLRHLGILERPEVFSGPIVGFPDRRCSTA